MSYLDSELRGFLRATTLMADNEFNDFLHTDLLKERTFTFTAIPFLINFLKSCVQKDSFEYPSFEKEKEEEKEKKENEEKEEKEKNNISPVVSTLFSTLEEEIENDN